MTSIDGKPVYPCGLIANSVFNDTFSQPTLLADSSVYNFTDRGITWKNEYKKYEPAGYSSPSDVSPPPNWALRYPNGYTEFPNLRDDEHFQVWMRTAGLPTFRKLFFRNDDETMRAGRYRIEAYMSALHPQQRQRLNHSIDLVPSASLLLDYPVKSFSGTKSIVISTVSWVGGKNPFLGWAYVAAAALFVLLGLAGTVRHLVKPRCAPCRPSRRCAVLTARDADHRAASRQAAGRHVAPQLEPGQVEGPAGCPLSLDSPSFQRPATDIFRPIPPPRFDLSPALERASRRPFFLRLGGKPRLSFFLSTESYTMGLLSTASKQQ